MDGVGDGLAGFGSGDRRGGRGNHWCCCCLKYFYCYWVYLWKSCTIPLFLLGVAVALDRSLFFFIRVLEMKYLIN